MATINFYLDKPLAKTATAIYLYFYNGRYLKFHTGEYITPNQWNEDKTVQAKKGFSKDFVLNDTLSALKEKVSSIYRNFKTLNGVEPDNNFMQAEINKLLSKQTTAPTADSRLLFFALLDHFIEEAGRLRKLNTVKTYKTLRAHLKGFTTATKYNLEFETINPLFKEKFQGYLVRQDNSGSSISKNFAILKTFLNYATEHGHNKSTDYLKFRFKRDEVITIALTEEEKNAIRLKDLSGFPKYERVRDVFIFGCETSLRFSDIQNLNPVNIKTKTIEGREINYLDLVSVKTGCEIQSPLNSIALEIIEKYKGRFQKCFPKISNQKFNEYIKEVGKLAEIDSPIHVVNQIGGKRLEKTLPKYEMISSHTQRRTFITLFLEKGGDLPACQVYTGHKSYKELQAYQKKTTDHRLKLALNAEDRFRKVI